MERLKKEVVFIDADNHRARVGVEITMRNGYPEFTVSAHFMGSFGQTLNKIKPANEYQKEIIDLWKRYHMKDVSTMHNFKEHLEGIITRIEVAERDKDKKVLEGDEAILENMEQEDIDADLLDAVKAYMKVMGTTDLENFQEAYQGAYNSHEDFARETAESLGEIDRNAHWPNNCIDWEEAARQLMQDYTEQDGFYFCIV